MSIRATSCEGKGLGLFETLVLTTSDLQPISTSWPWNDTSGMR